MTITYTPLRYPGGKTRLSPVVKQLYKSNKLCDGHYVEPYAGGAGVALELLMTEHARHVHLNDLNLPVYAFWHSVLNEPEALCRKVRDCKITVNAWRRHKSVLARTDDVDLITLGFSFLFLNRTNRSGILSGGVIGGLDQTGNYKIDARFNREGLIEKITRIAAFSHRIHIYNQDALTFLSDTVSTLPSNTLVYLDPPYYNKGQRLYDNHYVKSDHAEVARRVSKMKHHWIVSYDNVPEICGLYPQYRHCVYDLQYSAGEARMGSEIMFFSDSLSLAGVQLDSQDLSGLDRLAG
jgi:DNA adenine methylase